MLVTHLIISAKENNTSLLKISARYMAAETHAAEGQTSARWRTPEAEELN
jgi:hypothetical protein